MRQTPRGPAQRRAPSGRRSRRSAQGRRFLSPEGDVHVTYVQATDVAVLQFVGPVAVTAVRSQDRGAFSDPVMVSDPDRPLVGVPAPAGDGEGNPEFPALAVGPDGAMVVAWSDARHDDEDVRVSSRSFNSTIGVTSSSHLDVDFGTRMGLVSDRDAALTAWTDTRRRAQAGRRR